MSEMNKLLIPNTTQVPNVFFDRLLALLPAAPLKIYLAITRKTYGFQKTSDQIGNKQLSTATGLSRSSVIRAVQFLGDLLTIKPGGPGKGANVYSLNLDLTEAQIELLKRRASSAGATSSADDTSVKQNAQVVSPVSPIKTNISKPIGTNSKKQSSAVFSSKVSDPRIKELTAAWGALYRGRCGEPYPFMEKDFGGFKTALRHYDVPRLKELMALFFKSNNRWVKEESGFTVGVFVSKLASLASISRPQSFPQRELPA